MKQGRLLLAIASLSVAPATVAEHMEEVIVTANQEKRVIDVSDAQVISPDAAQLLRQAPGANVNSNGPLSGIPQYRGMSGPRVGVQLDGTQIAPAGPNWMDPPLSYAAAAQLESLELYRGIAPVSVVPESIGGAVNAVTRHADFTNASEINVEGQLMASGQTVNDGTQLSGALFLHNDSHRVRLAAMTESGDDAEFDDGDILPTEYERDRYSFGYGFRTGAHTLQFDYTRNETAESGTPSLPMDIDFIDGDLYSVNYRLDRSDWSIDARVFYSDLDHEMTNYHLRAAPMDGAMWRRNTTDSENLGAKLQFSTRDASGSWMVGLDYLDSTHNAGIDNPNNPMFFVTGFNDAERSLLGVFAERQQELGESWRAEFGLRYNRVETDADEVDATPAMMMPPAQMLRDAFNNADREQTDDNIDAVARFWYRASDELTGYVGVGRKTRSPSYQERYLWLPLQATGGLADGYTYTGNIDLDPEVAHELELGFDFSRDGFTASPRLFYREVDDYIQGTPSEVAPALRFVNMMNMNNGTNNPAPLQFTNVDANFWGFDVDWLAQLDERWSLGGLVSYVRGERDDSDDDLYRIAPLNATLELAYSTDRWGGAGTVVWVDDQNNVSDVNNEQATDGYTVLNLSAWWEIRDGLRLAAGLDNALDEDGEDHLGGYNRVMGNDDIAVGERLPIYGRNLFVRMDYRF